MGGDDAVTDAVDDGGGTARGPHADQFLRALVDTVPMLVAELDRSCRVRFANEAYRAWFGLDPALQIGRPIREVIGDAAFAVLRPCFEQALAGEEAHYSGEVPYHRGGTRLIHGTYLPVYDADGEVDGLYLLAMDLSDREELHRRLLAETVRARTVVDNAIDGIITIDEAGVIHAFNPAAERIFGYTAAEVIGCNVSLLMAEPDRSRHDQYLERYLATGERHIIGIGREVTGRHRDGTAIAVELAVAEFTEDGRRYFTGFTRDISERRRAEEAARERLAELARITRLHSMGELATGLAHEVNQPLTAVHANAEACLAMLDAGRLEPGAFRGALQQISQQGRRASEVVEQLRTFLRRQQSDEWTQQDPNDLVREVLPLLSHEMHVTGVAVDMDLADGLPRLTVNRVQIEQVLFNVMRNGIEAMDGLEGARILSIRTRRHDGAAPACEFDIRNTGDPIAEEHMERLFDPFFTTKTDGMGQGLAISRSIVEAHAGSLRAENRGAEGVAFRLLLPLQSEHAVHG